MSIRTIVEINHDYLLDLERHPEYFDELLRALSSGRVAMQEKYQLAPGIRFIAERHHSESITVKVE